MILSIFFWITNSITLKILIQIILCCVGSAGFLTGYNFSILANKVDSQNIGKCFAIGYALGSIGTFLLTKFPIVDLFSSWTSLFIYIPAIIINMILIIMNGDFIVENKSQKRIIEKDSIIALCVIIIIMSVLYSYITGVLSILMQGHDKNVVFDRIFLGIGIILAGIIVDKNKKILEFSTVISLVLPLIICIFIKEGIFLDILYSAHYFIGGFFTVFVAIFFMDLGQKNSKYICIASLGYSICRFIDGIMFFIAKVLMSNYVITILVLFIIFILLLSYYYFKYDKEMNKIRYEFLPKHKSKEELFEEFCYTYNISQREQEFLNLLLDKKTGKEISEELFITIGIVKNTLSRIYKKTNMNKKEILEYLRCSEC